MPTDARPIRRQRSFTLSEANDRKLARLCAARAREYADRGLQRLPDRLVSECLNEAIHRMPEPARSDR